MWNIWPWPNNFIFYNFKAAQNKVLKISHASSLRKTIELDSFSRRDFSRLITQLLQFGLSCSAVHSVDSKQLLQLLNSVLWSTHSVPNLNLGICLNTAIEKKKHSEGNVSYRTRVFKYLVIVASRQSFVPKEVDFLMTTIGHILEAERFVPAFFQGFRKGCFDFKSRNLLESSRWRSVHPWQTEGPSDQTSEWRPIKWILISSLTFSSSVLKASLTPCSSSYLREF